MNTDSETEKLTLESDLEADTTSVYRDSLINEFSLQTNTLKATLNQGVTPKEYEEMTSVIDAIERASETIDTVWQRYHSTN
jgi:type III secretion system YseE family protein